MYGGWGLSMWWCMGLLGGSMVWGLRLGIFFGEVTVEAWFVMVWVFG